MRSLGVLAVCLLLLSGCSTDEPDDTDQPDQSTVSATPDVAPTTSTPPLDSASATTASPPTTSTPTTTTAATTSSAPESPTSDAAPPAPTQEAPKPEPNPCSGDAISTDLFGYVGAVEVFVCESGWAYATVLEGGGDTEFIAQRVDGVWQHVIGMGSPTCQDELLAQGAPPSVVVDVLPCDVMYPPGQPTAPEQPVSDCAVQTELYGTAYADLSGVGCDEARTQWAAAATGNLGSWDEAVITPDGWECTVAPYDTTSLSAGACYASGDRRFVLYL